jgi:hypothetical protein
VITEHALCALPAGHPDWFHLVVKVQRRGSTDNWVIEHCGFWYTPDGDWFPSITHAAQYDERGALGLAEYLKSQV